MTLTKITGKLARDRNGTWTYRYDLYGTGRVMADDDDESDNYDDDEGKKSISLWKY